MNRRCWSLIIATAFLLIPVGFGLPGSASEPEAGTGAETKQSDTLMQGRVFKIDSLTGATMQRLARPAASSDLSAKTELLPLKGKSSQNQDLSANETLKARVLQAAGMGGLKSMTPGTGKRSSFSLNARELKRLSQYDITVLIDASGSMSRKDCEPLNIFTGDGKVSRWEWCRQQTTILLQEVTEVFPSGITVIPFASSAQRYTNVSPAAITEIFREASPGGGTRLDAALDVELSSYFSERASGLRKKPLLIAVITDGVPNFPRLVMNEIAEVSRLVRPGEVRIEFFLIGDERGGAAFVEALSHVGAPFEVVTRHSFAEISEEGLPRSLAHSVETAGN